MSPQSCADLSLANGERMFGTAPVATHWLLIEYPEPWPSSVFSEGVLPQSLRQLLFALRPKVPKSRVLLIKQPDRHEAVRCFVAVCGESHSWMRQYRVGSYADLLAIDFVGDITGPAPDECVAELYTICAHGTHDRCCARLGAPIFDHLSRQFGDAVWQSSHIGGDRFAPNLLCFPSGLCYGRVTRTQATDIVLASRARSIYLDALRGRSCYSQPEQAAEFFVRHQSKDVRDGLVLRQSGRAAPDAWRVQFQSRRTGMVHDVTLRREASVWTPTSCESQAPQAQTQYVLCDYTVTAGRSAP